VKYRLFAISLLALFISPQLYSQSQNKTNDALLKQVREVLKKTPLIDGHNDLPSELYQRYKNHLDQVDLSDTSKLTPPLQTDLARLRTGMVGGQFWSVYVPVETEGANAIRSVLEQIDVVDRFVQRYPQAFEMAYTAADIQRIHSKGKVASLIGVEGGHCIDNSLAVLRQLYVCGARYMTLTHWKNTNWADSATDDPKHDGLTAFGEQVVKEMNRLGMLVDISHVSAVTMNKVLDITQAPVIFSHSSVRAISGHPRNVPDDVLKRLPVNRGVVMVNFAPSFVSEEVRQYSANLDAEEARLKAIYIGNPDGLKEQLEAWKQKNPEPRATLSQLADHIDYIRKIAGIDFIGIGSDFDGIKTAPAGLEDVSHFPDLFVELLRRGYTKEDIAKIAGGNVLRVMKTSEEVAVRLQKEKPASDALIDDLDKKEIPK
jgi:membrane dipeptidase